MQNYGVSLHQLSSKRNFTEHLKVNDSAAFNSSSTRKPEPILQAQWAEQGYISLHFSFFCQEDERIFLLNNFF